MDATTTDIKSAAVQALVYMAVCVHRWTRATHSLSHSVGLSALVRLVVGVLSLAGTT